MYKINTIGYNSNLYIKTFSRKTKVPLFINEKRNRMNMIKHPVIVAINIGVKKT